MLFVCGVYTPNLVQAKKNNKPCGLCLFFLLTAFLLVPWKWGIGRQGFLYFRFLFLKLFLFPGVVCLLVMVEFLWEVKLILAQLLGTDARRIAVFSKGTCKGLNG